RQGEKLSHTERVGRDPARAPEPRKPERKPRRRIVKLEERMTPGTSAQHNETVVRDPAEAEPKAAEPRTDKPKGRFRVVKLEERIAPGINLPNHNETLVRDTWGRRRS